MQAAASANYEVHVGHGTHWTIESIHKFKGAAVRQAEALLSGKDVPGVRVLEERPSAAPKIVFEKAGQVAEKPIAIVPVEDAPPCETADDLFQFEARLAGARLLRAFLDQVGMSCFELLHDYGRLRQIIRHDTLYPQALHRIGSIQARKTETKPADRIAVLDAAVTEIAERARENPDVPRFREILEQDGADALARAVAAEIADPGARAYMRGAALAEALGRQADWNGKVVFLVDRLESGAGDEAVAEIDAVIAEILDGSQALQEVLGGMGDLATALKTIAQLGFGGCKRSGGRGSCLGPLNAALAKHPLTKTQAILYGRIERALRGIKLLTRQDATADRDALIGLLGVLAAPGGLRGERSLAEAVTTRARMTFGANGQDLTPEEAIAHIQTFLPSRAACLGYLLDLSGTPFGAKNQALVLKALLGLLEQIKDLAGLLPASGTQADKMAAIQDLRPRLAGGGLPAELRAEIVRRLERILAGKPVTTGQGTKAAAPAPQAPASQSPSSARPAAAAGNPVPPPAAGPAAPKPEVRRPGGDLPRTTFANGEYIFHKGDPGDEAYLVASGEIEILGVYPDGRERILSTLMRGDIFGEMALINHKPRVAAARAKGDVELVVVSSDSFRSRLDKLAETDRMMRRLIDAFAARLAALVGN